jgi:hypothetical protein
VDGGRAPDDARGPPRWAVERQQLPLSRTACAVRRGGPAQAGAQRPSVFGLSRGRRPAPAPSRRRGRRPGRGRAGPAW